MLTTSKTESEISLYKLPSLNNKSEEKVSKNDINEKHKIFNDDGFWYVIDNGFIKMEDYKNSI